LSPPFEFCYEDPWFVAINKPSGILTQSAWGVPSVQTCLAKYFRSHDMPQPFVEVPHRLDRGSSGVLLVARNKKALSSFSQQFLHRVPKKTYWVLCERAVEGASGMWTDWMRKIENEPKAEIVVEEDEGAKRAELTFERIAVSSDTSLLRIEMATGRMHQIRLQLASRGHPVVGDIAYGATRPWFASMNEHVDHEHQEHIALHARTLSLRHPKDASPLTIEASFPKHWQSTFEALQFDPSVSSLVR
jgi:23S rRNA pseudouridine1911/1915/1917 synthase